ncbi:hypothetical protein [Aminobacter ciceronei]|uniref:LDH2 family malate/lactate/ureidoglycolate dehydrogenase n=1 Tax=Aminobacter ciceronei TaxID=150723 RepID=A0ABR6C285_9HYPH|nr:hypothetical protein [Aminobacter ciceronei]MBA8905044.1 LDH2 family malate/lactate/ureidoglycolate dehydrogenase [Aminobacter ciceronei]MBA9019094.1 LDH2 family malate/lactate/ureidoglycolate dehydrogenase [Aminobacter ciceronei]
MRDVTPPAPASQEIALPPEASAAEAADFARGIAVLDRLARRVKELARTQEREDKQ